MSRSITYRTRLAGVVRIALTLAATVTLFGCVPDGQKPASGKDYPPAAALSSLALSPANPQLAMGTAQPFALRAVTTQGESLDLTHAARFVVKAPSGETLAPLADQPDVLPFAAPGHYSVVATYDGRTVVTDVHVTAATLTTLSVSPSTPKVPKGLTKQFTASAKFSDGTTQDVTRMAAWSAKDTTGTGVALVDTTGLVSALTEGKARIQARYLTKTSYTTLEVTPAARIALAVSPSNPSIAKGSSVAFAASATYSDGSTADVTAQVTWAVADVTGTGVAAISSGGVAFGRLVGVAAVSAELDTDLAETHLTVTPATVSALAITPTTATLPKGVTQQLTATATMTDGATQDVTAMVTWTAADVSGTGVASVDAKGLVTANQVGLASVSCAISGKTATAQVQVVAATLTGLRVTPATVSVLRGTVVALTATGSYSDGSVQNLSAVATWTTRDVTGSGVASVDAKGVLTVSSVGTAVVTATVGRLSATASVEGQAPRPVSIQVSLSGATLVQNDRWPYAAVATLSDGSAQDITSMATWSATDLTGSGVAAVDAKGLVTASAPGTASIQASYAGLTSSVAVTVVATGFTKIPTGLTSYFYNMWSPGGDSLWVVGDKGVLLRYEGDSVSAATFGASEQLYGIWGSSDHDVWISSQSGNLFHFDGTAWTKQTFPGNSLFSVWGSAASDVWLGSSLAVERWNGVAWSQAAPSTTFSIWGTASSNVWMGTSSIAHWNGTTMTTLTSPVLTGALWGIHGSSSRDIWFTISDGHILHYNGAAFTDVPSGTTAGVSSVYSISSSEAYAVTHSAQLLQWNGTAWSLAPLSRTTGFLGVYPTASYLWITAFDGWLLRRHR